MKIAFFKTDFLPVMEREIDGTRQSDNE
jgi:hypothetical protein